MIDRPDIETYPFQRTETGEEACRLHFQFNEAAAPETHIAARAVRLTAADGTHSYKLGIVNPHIPAERSAEGLTLWFYNCDAMKLMLDLSADVPETEDGYLGPLNAKTMNELLATLQDISIAMHHNHEARRDPVGQTKAPRLI